MEEKRGKGEGEDPRGGDRPGKSGMLSKSIRKKKKKGNKGRRRGKENVRAPRHRPCPRQPCYLSNENKLRDISKK